MKSIADSFKRTLTFDCPIATKVHLFKAGLLIFLVDVIKLCRFNMN